MHLGMKSVFAFVVAGMFAVSGCDESPKTPPTQPPASPKPAVAPAAPATGSAQSGDAAKNISPEQLMQGVPYTATAKRDPFASLAVKADLSKKPGVGSLESFEAGEFRLIAVLWDSTGPYASLTLPDGKSYTVRQGTKVGLYGGKVVKISQDSLIIREMVKNYKGVLAPKDTVLKLRRGDEQ